MQKKFLFCNQKKYHVDENILFYSEIIIGHPHTAKILHSKELTVKLALEI